MSMKLGQAEVVGAYPGRRDAFHAPAVLVCCEHEVKPGDSVRFTNTLLHTVEPSERDDRHGVVDPFLKEIKPGEMFWVLLEPALVTDLTHQFGITTDLTPLPLPVQDDEYDDSYDSRRCRLEGC